MAKSFTPIFFSLFCLAFNGSEEYQTYCNARFDFCVKYPKSFPIKEESQNGDGAIFISTNKKAQVWAYGRLAIEDLNWLDQEFGFDTQKIKLTYKVMKATWFVFSGIDDKGITFTKRQ